MNGLPLLILRLSAWIFLFLFPLLNQAHAGEPVQTLGDCLVAGQGVPGLEAFDQAMADYMTARGVSAGTLAVAWNGKLVYARGFNCAQKTAPGPVDPATRFRIASVTKPITSAAILRLAGLGALRLDDKVVTYVDLNPNKIAGFDPRVNDISIANLLDHTGGFDPSLTFEPMFHDREIAAWAGKPLPIAQKDIIGYMASTPLSHDPGTVYAYSNYGYMLLGRVIEAVSGESYEIHVQRHIFAPVGVTVMRLGRSLQRNRAAGETRYRSIYEGTSVLSQEPVAVPSPYGAFNLENMDSHGGFIATAPELCRVADKYEVIRAAAPANVTTGDNAGGAQWGFFGSLPGTVSFAFHGASGLSLAALVNQRDDPSGLEYFNALYDVLMDAAARTTVWPSGDLFPVYLGKLPQRDQNPSPAALLLLGGDAP